MNPSAASLLAPYSDSGRAAESSCSASVCFPKIAGVDVNKIRLAPWRRMLSSTL